MAIRMGDWKLVKTHDGLLGGDPDVLSDLSSAELFNLADDISESRNLADQVPGADCTLAVACTPDQLRIQVSSNGPCQADSAGGST